MNRQPGKNICQSPGTTNANVGGFPKKIHTTTAISILPTDRKVLLYSSKECLLPKDGEKGRFPNDGYCIPSLDRWMDICGARKSLPTINDNIRYLFD